MEVLFFQMEILFFRRHNLQSGDGCGESDVIIEVNKGEIV